MKYCVYYHLSISHYTLSAPQCMTLHANDLRCTDKLRSFLLTFRRLCRLKGCIASVHYTICNRARWSDECKITGFMRLYGPPVRTTIMSCDEMRNNYDKVRASKFFFIPRTEIFYKLASKIVDRLSMALQRRRDHVMMNNDAP